MRAAGLVVDSTGGCESGSSPNISPLRSEPPPPACTWQDPGTPPRTGKSFYTHSKTTRFNKDYTGGGWGGGDLIPGSHLNRDDAARFMVVRLAQVVLVQLVELWVGLVAERFVTHGAEVEVEAVQQEVNFNSCSSGLWAHSRSRTQDEEGAVHRAA